MAFPTYSTAGGTTAQVIAPNLSQFARGIDATFEADFFDDAPANTIAAVPVNPTTDPKYTIVSPSGAEVANGVGVPGAAPGRWNATWSVPPDAELSTQNGKWQIYWRMETASNRQLEKELSFDVIELRTPETLEDLRATSYMVYQGKQTRIVLRLPKEATELTVALIPPSSIDSPCPEATAVFTASKVDATVNMVEEQNMFSYWADTGALTMPGQYQVLWNYRHTVTSPEETVVQNVFVAPPVFWNLSASLKKLIDAVQKKQGTIQAITDDDAYEYITQGIGIMNGVNPATNWTMTNFPYSSSTVRFIIEAAALWAMNARQLMAGELAFSFSGQQVTLDLDQTGVYGDMAQKLLDHLTGDGKGSWPSTKVDIMRQASPAAVVGNRINPGNSYNYGQTYKVWQTRVGPNQVPLFEQYPGAGINFGWTLTDVQVFLGLG